jgi:hypothetical protein
MEINIDSNLVATLERIATAQNTTPAEQAAHILNSHLRAQYVIQ